MPDGRTLDPTGKAQADLQKDGVEITPIPQFTIKTTNLTTSGKTFVNVCTHPDVVPPRNVKRLNEQGEEVEGLSVPVAVGIGRRGGKGGKDSVTFDCVVNEAVMEEIAKDEQGGYRDFIVQLVMQYVENKSEKKVEEGGEKERGKRQATERTHQLPTL